jgi:hypothetical protein
MTIAESIQLNKEQIARAFGVPAHMLAGPDRTAMPRYWSLCMISENHGTVGPAGCTFSHAPDKHERVLVVEVPAAAGAPVDQVNLQLVTSAGGQADLDRALRAAQAWVNEEYMCGRRMGKGEPAMSDRADTAKTECIAAILALAAPVAALAGQVAVPSQSWEAIGPLPVDRDENGWWSHPAIPNFDEDVDSYLAWVKAVGLEMKYKALESDPDHPLYNAWFEEGECNASSWEPEEPTGDGWFTFSIHDSEDGPIWAWARRVDRAAVRASTSGERQEGGSRG